MADLLDFDTEELRRIAYGATRTVLALSPHYVVKIPRSAEFGTDPNRWEVENFLRAEDEGWSDGLVPIVAWADDFSWIVCERVEQLPSEDFLDSDTREEWHALASFLEAHDVADGHVANFGRTSSGRVVCLDYAT